MQFYAVDRRIGGLESQAGREFAKRAVDRRIGGLENERILGKLQLVVDRRIGGLEITSSGSWRS